MNHLLEQSEKDFKKSLERLKPHDILALAQLIQREILLEQDDHSRVVARWECAKTLGDESVEAVRFLADKEESEIRLNSLQQKRTICLSLSEGTTLPPVKRSPIKSKSVQDLCSPRHSFTSISDTNANNIDNNNTQETFHSVVLRKTSQPGTPPSMSRRFSNSSNSSAVSENDPHTTTVIVNSKRNGSKVCGSGSGNFHSFKSMPVAAADEPHFTSIQLRQTANRNRLSEQFDSTTDESSAVNKITDSGDKQTRREQTKSTTTVCTGDNHQNEDTNVGGVEEESIDARSVIANFERLLNNGAEGAPRTKPLSYMAKRVSCSSIELSSGSNTYSSLPGRPTASHTTDLGPRRSAGIIEMSKPTPDHVRSPATVGRNVRIPTKISENEALEDVPTGGDTVVASPCVAMREGRNGASQRSLSTSAMSSLPKVDGGCVWVPTRDDSSNSSRLRYSIVVDDDTSHSNSNSLERTNEDGDNLDAEKVMSPITLQTWDPILLLNKLYHIDDCIEEDSEICQHGEFIEGFMDKLPFQKTKGTLLKTWKRKFFRAQNGQLKYYESPKSANPEGIIQLSGGSIDPLGENAIGIDDGRGEYTTVRCLNSTDFDKWILALGSHTIERDHLDSCVVVPPLRLVDNPPTTKKIVVIDFGSCSIRAGVLREQPSLPEIYFPHNVAMDRNNRIISLGSEAFKKSVRTDCDIQRPLKSESTLENFAFERGIVKAMFQKIFADLKINGKEYTIFLSLPPNVSGMVRIRLADVLMNELNCIGVSMCGQALLALHAYGEPTGLLVELGNRVEILPVTEGIVQNGGVSRQVYGGRLILEAFNLHLAHRKYRFNSPSELLMARYAMEQCAFVSSERNQINTDIPKNVDLSSFDLPKDYLQSIKVSGDTSRCAEGLFDPELFGLDAPSLPKLILRSVQACPMDFRRTLYRSIFLSGGSSLLPGLSCRLENEVSRLVPSTCVVRVHTAPHRQHLSYLGAGLVASQDSFQATCVNSVEWKSANPGEKQRFQMKWHA